MLRRLLTDLRGCNLFGRCRYPLRVEYVPQISRIYTDLSWEVLVTQISQMTQIFFIGYFYSSDFTELIRRFPATSITHGFTRRRPVRSLQIPPLEWNMSHRFHRFAQIFPASISFPSIFFLHFSFLILSSFSLHYPFLLFYLFTFLLFYFFTFKKAAAKK